jgi:cytochrome c peroxidase
MNRYVITISAIAGLIIIIGALARDMHTERRDKQRAILERITLSAQQTTEAFAVATQSIQPGDSAKRLLAFYEDVRRAYKACEPLIEYLDPGTVTAHMNGAPLPKLDPKSTFIEVLEPEGLQVIDELLFEDEVISVEQITLLRDRADRLSTAMRYVVSLLRAAPWTDRMMLESVRTGVLRVTAMGITGFDRPASDPTLVDNIPALETLRDILATYGPWCEVASTQKILTDALSHIDAAVGEMRTPFDECDRLELIRSALDPLYADVARLQTALQIEFADEVGNGLVVVNPRGTSMFADDVFNPYATTGMTAVSHTPEMVELGRLLFFDPVLSSTGERACASCHQPELAFTDGRQTSLALGRTKSIQRNAPTLINSVYARRFFYDLRALRLNDVISHVVTHEDEFGSSLLDMVGRLRDSDEYMQRFERAFNVKGPEAIDATHVGLAIGAYVATLRSFNSRIDRYLRGEAVQISLSERRGMNLFMGKAVCATCHFPPTFAGYVPPAFVESESEILGVPMRVDTANARPDSDVGRAAGIRREHSEIYRHSFKTPTVRNVELTAPYFHNGAYQNLEQVVDFYARGGGKGIGWDLPYQTLPFDNLDLTQQDRTDIIAFMRALTDTTGLTKRPTRLPKMRSSTARRTIGGDY